MKKLRPLGKWVLVNVVSAGQTVGGIVLPDSADKQSEFLVTGIGEEVTRVKVGDEVVFMMPQAIKVDLPKVEKGQVLIHQDHIFGVLTK